MMGGSARVDLNSSFSATPPKIEPKPQHHIIKHTSTSLPRSHHKKKLKTLNLNIVDNNSSSSNSCSNFNSSNNNSSNVNKEKTSSNHNNVNIKTSSSNSKSNVELVKRQSFHDVSHSTLSMFTKPILNSLENEIDINQEPTPKVCTKKTKTSSVFTVNFTLNLCLVVSRFCIENSKHLRKLA